MEPHSILTIKPNVTQAEALRVFSANGPTALYWRLRSGPLQRVADVYVPFRLYRVSYQMGKATHERLFALDSVDGSLDLFEFPKPLREDELLSLTTRNRPAPVLEDSRAQDLLREKALRVIFQQGFFKLRNPQIEITREGAEFHLPYWLGFYGSSTKLRCRVLDAVRRRIEGAKASAFFEQWLAA